MKTAVVYASRTGNTRRAAELIGTTIEDRGHEVSIQSVDALDYKALADAELIVFGTWVAGHFVIGQKPGDAKRLAMVPKLTGKQVALFLTYAINPGRALGKFERMLEAEGASVLGGYAWKRNALPAGVEDFVDGVLEAATQTTAATPAWFDRALSQTPESHRVHCRGCDIHYLAWGRRGAPGLVFIHGGAAHAHWWSFLVPLLADNYRVTAVDLSGHGDSGRRDSYVLDDWAAEVMSVAADADIRGRPVVIGHSMGGFVSIGTAAEYGDELAGIVILDSPVSAPDPELEAAREGNIFGRLKVYPDIDTALGRFRTVPEQEHYLPFVMDHVARNSLREVDSGFSWKYDPDIFVPPRSEPRELLSEVSCRVALFRAENGLVTPEIGAYMYDLLGRVAPVVEIPEAGHHLMLDQPLLLLTALRTLLADWEHSSPLTAA